MKKSISLLLFVVFCLSLCAFSSAELTPEEKEKIFFEVAEEKGLTEFIEQVLKLKEAVQSKSDDLNLPVSSLPEMVVVESAPSSHFEPDLQPGQHCLEILDVALVPVDNGIYRPNVKFRNLFPEDASGYYPDHVQIYMTYLDKEGFSVQSSEAYLKCMGYGEGSWTDATSSPIKLEPIDVSEIDSISITGYRFTGKMGNETVINYFPFYPSLNFPVSELLPEGRATSAEDSPVVVEEAKFDTRSRGLAISAKVRNTSEIKRDVINVYFKILDHSGDIIKDGRLLAKDLNAGQAAWGTSDSILGVSMDDISSVEFVSYAYARFTNGNRNSWSWSGNDAGGDFSEPFAFTFDELK